MPFGRYEKPLAQEIQYFGLLLTAVQLTNLNSSVDCTHSKVVLYVGYGFLLAALVTFIILLWIEWSYDNGRIYKEDDTTGTDRPVTKVLLEVIGMTLFFFALIAFMALLIWGVAMSGCNGPTVCPPCNCSYNCTQSPAVCTTCNCTYTVSSSNPYGNDSISLIKPNL